MGNLVSLPQPSFTQAVKMALSRLADYRGRSRRAEFWWAALAYAVFSWIVGIVLQFTVPYIVATVVSILLMYLLFGVTVRRLHDTGHSGVWVVVSWAATAIVNIMFAQAQASGALQSGNPSEVMAVFANPVLAIAMAVSTITSLVIFVMCILDSKPEANKYGPSPKYLDETTDEQAL